MSPLTDLDRTAILRIQARFFGAPVEVWDPSFLEHEEFTLQPGLLAEVLPGDSGQIDMTHVLVGPTYRAPWRRLVWPDRLSARVAVLTHVPTAGRVLYRAGSAKWHLPPPQGTVITVRAGDNRSFRAIALHPGVCHKPGSWIGCKARILWAVSQRTERRLPVDWQPLADGTFTSHFARCPHAKYFRTTPPHRSPAPR